MSFTFTTWTTLPEHSELIGGVIFRKPMGTKLHGLCELLIGQMLRELGYEFAGTEVEIRIDTDWQPVPDVVGQWENQTGESYPISPRSLTVFEVMSPDDTFTGLIRKCKAYAEFGIQDILVVDPEQLEAWAWINGTLVPCGNKFVLETSRKMFNYAQLFEALKGSAK